MLVVTLNKLIREIMYYSKPIYLARGRPKPLKVWNTGNRKTLRFLDAPVENFLEY